MALSLSLERHTRAVGLSGEQLRSSLTRALHLWRDAVQNLEMEPHDEPAAQQQQQQTLHALSVASPSAAAAAAAASANKVASSTRFLSPLGAIPEVGAAATNRGDSTPADGAMIPAAGAPSESADGTAASAAAQESAVPQWTTVVTPIDAALVADSTSSVDAAPPPLPQFPLGRTATAPESSSAGTSGGSSFDFPANLLASAAAARSLIAGGGLGGGSGASSIGRQLGLHASAAMGARQPSAPNTPASLSSRGHGGGAPTLTAAHSLSLPNSATRLRRPSVSLLTSAHELPDAEAALGRAQSASTSARSGGLMSPAAAAAATPNAASTSAAASASASASASAHSAAASSSFAYALPSMLSSAALASASASASAAPAPAFARPDAMISYSRKDLPFVRLLASAFEHSGRSVWVDFQSIPKAVDFMDSIRSGIRESNSFIYIISPDSVASKYCNLELDLALEFGKRIVPIVVREVSPEKVRPEISAVNWIVCCAKNPVVPASTRGNGPSPPAVPAAPPSAYLHDLFPHILASVLIDPAYVLMHTKLLVRAMEWSESGEDSSFLATGRELEEANKFLARSQGYQRAYAAEAALRQQAQQQGLPTRSGRTGSISAGSAVLLNAPAVTRIQKLFLFASNERVQSMQKKERMLLKFLEDVSNDDTGMQTAAAGGVGAGGNSPGSVSSSLLSFASLTDPSSTLHHDIAGLDDPANEDLDVPTTPDRSNSSRETSPQRREQDLGRSGSRERGTPATTTTTTSVERFEHGSLSNRGSLSGAAADGTPATGMRSRFGSTASRSSGGTPAPSLTPHRRRSSFSASGGAGARAGGSAVLNHFSLVTSRASLFHRGGGLRSLLAAQAELMSGFLAVVEARERDRAKEEALRADQERAEQEARKRALEAAATAAVAGASESAATAATTEASLSPEWSPGSAAASAAAAAVAAAAAASSAAASVSSSVSPAAPPAPSTSHSLLSRARHQFARLRFELYTLHESLGFHLALRALLSLEVGIVMIALLLALGPLSPASTPPLFSRAFHLLQLGSLGAFALEMGVFVLPIHAGWRRLKHQPVYVASLVLLVFIGAIEAWRSWSGCDRWPPISLGASAIQAGPSSAVVAAACSGNLLVWSLLFRSWHVLLRGGHCLLLHPLYFSLSSLHASVVANRSLVSKLKTMLRLLNGEMAQKENQTKLKWERLKSFHPARRFSIAPGSGGAGGLPGLPIPPPNLALNAAAPSGSPTSRASSVAAASKARRSLPPTSMLPGGYATIPRATAGSRGSTILPGAYGGAGGGVASLVASQAPRRSILMTSPSKHRGAVGQFATMPALSAAIASAAVAAAETSLANSPVDEPLSASLPPPLPPSPLSASGSADPEQQRDSSISVSVRISPIHEPDIDVTPESAGSSGSASADPPESTPVAEDSSTQHPPPHPPRVDTRRASDADQPPQQLPSPPPDIPPEEDGEGSSQSAHESSEGPSDGDDDDDDEEDVEDEGDDEDENGAKVHDGGEPTSVREHHATAAPPNLQLVVSSPLQQQQQQHQRSSESNFPGSHSALPPPHPPHVAALPVASAEPPSAAASATPSSSTPAAAVSPAAAPSSSSLDVLHLTSPPSAFSPRSLPTPPSDPLAAASTAAASASATGASASPVRTGSVALTPNAETALSPESVDPPPPPRAQAKGGRVGSVGVRKKSRRDD